jgi:hypothetical protein
MLGALAPTLLVLAFNVLVDPYGANPLRIRFERPLMDINQRFMYPQVLRSGEFDSAVFGTSAVRLLKPSDLEASFGGHFANFGINAATPSEQSKAVSLYLSHTPHLRMLVWGIDELWCAANPEARDARVPERAFPPWLYDGSGFAMIPHLFNLRTTEISARLVLNRLGLMKERLPRNGYEVFTPPEESYDLARARQHIRSGFREGEEAMSTHFGSADDLADRSFPALHSLDQALAALPEGAQLIAVFPPPHIAFQPAPGSAAAMRDTMCKERVAAIVAAHKGVTVDFRFASPITREDENYWDPLHYRVPIAKRIVEALAEAKAGKTDAADFRVTVPSDAGGS